VNEKCQEIIDRRQYCAQKETEMTDETKVQGKSAKNWRHRKLLAVSDKRTKRALNYRAIVRYIITPQTKSCTLVKEFRCTELESLSEAVTKPSLAQLAGTACRKLSVRVNYDGTNYNRYTWKLVILHAQTS